MKQARIGELLVEQGVASPELVERALGEARARGEHVCTRLLALGVDERALAAALSEKLGYPGVDLSRSTVELPLLDLVPIAVAEGDLILPISSDGGRLHLAMAQPADEKILAEFRFVTGKEVSPWIAVTGALRGTIDAAYRAKARGEPLLPGPHAEVRDRAFICLASYDESKVELAALEPEEAPLVPEELTAEEQAALEVVVEVDGEEPPPGRVRRVLVVDDEPEIRTLLQKTLEHHGYAVAVAGDGAEGLSLAERDLPDLVLLDAMLPKVHGFDVCRRIKAAPRTRKIPVIMMTAIYRGWRFAQDARETYGAEDYVEKPFRADDLLRRVERVLEATAGREVAPRAAANPALQKGKELLLAGRLGEAVAAFEAATRADPWSADAWFHLARALRAEDDPFRAMTAFERALEIRSNHLSALRALAGLYEEKGFRRKAAEALERAFAAASDPETRGSVKEELLRLLG